MRFYILLGLALLIFTSCGNQKKNDSPESGFVEQPKTKFTSETAGFGIDFPGTPTEETEDIPTEVGLIKTTYFSYEKSSREAYVVSCSEYPEALIAGVDPYELMNSSKNGIVASVNGRILDERQVRDGKYPALYCRFEFESTLLTIQLIWYKNQMYQVSVAHEGAVSDREAADKFIRSFTIIESEG